MKQLYEVGEVVILIEDGKTYTVCVAVPPKEMFFDRVMNYMRHSDGDTYGYLLNERFESKNGYAGECLWSEASLRRKHEPSQQSFKQLMTTLKSPQKVEWD